MYACPIIYNTFIDKTILLNGLIRIIQAISFTIRAMVSLVLFSFYFILLFTVHDSICLLKDIFFADKDSKYLEISQIEP